MDQSLPRTGLREFESATVLFLVSLFIYSFTFNIDTLLEIDDNAHFHVKYLTFIAHYCKRCCYIRVNNRSRPFCCPFAVDSSFDSQQPVIIIVLSYRQ